MVLEDPIHAFDQAVVRLKESVTRSEAPALGDDRLVLELRHFRDFELDQVARCGLHPFQPTLVEPVPVLEVVAAPAGVELCPASESRLVGDQVRTQIDVAVEEPALGTERGWDDEETGARLVEGDHGVLERDRVERVEGLRGVQPVLEPEPALLEPAAILAEEGVAGVHLLPPLAALRDRAPRTGSGNAPLPCRERSSFPVASFRRPSIVGSGSFGCNLRTAST